MEKTAALNKLAVAVTNYIQAEQNYVKVASAAQQYVMKKQAGFMDMFKAAPPPPPAAKGHGKEIAALLGALGLGGAGAYGATHPDQMHQLGQSAAGKGADMLSPLESKLQQSGISHDKLTQLIDSLTLKSM